MNTEYSYDCKAIKNDLEDLLTEKRFEHTLGVAYTAAALAMAYDEDMQKAYVAGLLHDCTKYMSQDENLVFCKNHHITLSKAELKTSSLLHAKTGCKMAEEKYHIKDPEILNAICFHTTGCPDMTMLEKIIFIADYIEPQRCFDPDLPFIRNMAFHNLNEAIIKILRNTLVHLEQSATTIDPMTQKTYDFYCRMEKQHD